MGESLHAREMEAVEHAARRLQAPMLPEQLAEALIDLLEELLGYEYGAVLVVDEDGWLQPYALSRQGQGPDFVAADKALVRSHGVAVGRGVTGWVAEHGRSVRLDDVRSDPRYLAVRPEIRSELCVPLVSAGRVVGVVNIESTTPGRYSMADERVLSIVAAQMAAAIRAAELHERILRDEQRLRHLDRMEAIARLASGAAHDFRGLLTAIRGTAQMAAASLPGGHAAHEDLAAIVATADRGSALSDQLMDLSRASGLHPSVLDLNAAIEELHPVLQRIAGPDHEIALALDAGASQAVLDPHAFERILANLVRNARDAAPAGGSIEIATRQLRVAPPGDRAAPRARHADPADPADPMSPPPPRRLAAGAYVAVDVRDDGQGMDEATLAQALDPFYTTKPADRGTGLGLAIVDGLVSQSGGEVVIGSRPGVGTTVRIVLVGAPG